MVRRTLKTLQHLLQDFHNVSDQFGTLMHSMVKTVRNSHSQMFQNFTGKHLCWSLFLIKLQTRTPFFYRTPLVAASKLCFRPVFFQLNRPIPSMSFRNLITGKELQGSRQEGNRLRYQFGRFQERDEGKYVCEVKNLYGQTSSKTAYLKLEGKFSSLFTRLRNQLSHIYFILNPPSLIYYLFQKTNPSYLF